MVNQLRQINLTDSQLASAKSQIAESLASLAAAREQAAGQTDLGGMLSVSTVSGILTAQNFSMPAGYLTDGSFHPVDSDQLSFEAGKG